MDVSRITRGRVELRLEAVKIADVVSQALETVNPVLRERHHHLTLTPYPDTLMVLGDQARLVQCLVNVLTNAAKYTAPGGHICVEVHQEGSAAVMSVSDDGIGIAPELLPHVFDLFVQGDRTLDRSQGGLGIGLSVVERLIRKHGGEVSAHSAGLGKGTTIRIALPLMTTANALEAHHVAAHGKHRRVLIVDDNADATDSLAAVLELEGHEVLSAYAGAEALDVVRDKRPEVVLLDIGLPGMDGYVVAKRIRENEGGAHIRIVALTGYGQAEDRKRALENGFDFHLTKPVNLDQLLELLD